MKTSKILKHIEKSGTAFKLNISEKLLSVAVNSDILNEINTTPNSRDEVLGDMEVEFIIRTNTPERIKLVGCIITEVFKVPVKNIDGTTSEVGILGIKYEASIHEK